MKRRNATPEYDEEEYTGYDEPQPPEQEPGWDVDMGGDEDEKPARRTILKPRTRHPSFILAVLVNTMRTLVLLVLLCSLAGIGAVVGIAKAYVETAPTLDLAALNEQAQTTFIYDAEGNLITDYKGTENRVMVSIHQMPLMLRYAFVAVEDARFFSHTGVDLKRIVGAFVTNFVSSSQQGGSTITQQLIKNTILSAEQSYKRKIQEAYLAMQLETQYSKDEILECYLNTIFLGENYYGVYVAAEGFFGKSLDALTLRECAMLAGVTNNPYYYNPRRNLYLRTSETTDYTAITNNRTDYVLRCMYENQFITREEYQAALNPAQATVLRTAEGEGELYRYPHYVEYAVRDVIDTLLSMNGLEDTAKNRALMDTELRTGGYRVHLALDTQIQATLEETIYTYSDWPGLANPDDSVYRARKSDGTYEEIVQPQCAAVVLDYRTGELKAIVGSRTAPTQRRTLNRACDMEMPVGSAIKPIAVYAPAFEMGAYGGSVVYNMPVPIPGWKDATGADSWPQNYGGSSYRGPETLRTALVKSDNTAAAQALMTYVSVDRSVDFLMRLGVSEDHIQKTPFGVSLGSSGISPVEMAVAYGVLGSGGIYQSPISFLALYDAHGSVLYDAHQSQTRRQVFSPSTAWLTIDILKDVVSKGTGTNAKISGQTVAGKTGTNSDQKGVFFCGMTGWYAGSVWIGHDNYKSLSSKTTGGNSAAKLWQTFMSRIHSQKGLADRAILDGMASEYGLVRVETCAVSGQLATEACRNDAMEYGTVVDYAAANYMPQTYCQMHISLTLCSGSGLIATDYCPAEQRVTQSAIVVPQGHPLHALIGSQYSSQLLNYLGEFSTLRLTGDAAGNQAQISTMTCTLHNAYTQTPGYDPIVDNVLKPDAQRLITLAYTQLAGMDTSTWAYLNLRNAIDALNAVLTGTPSVEQLTQAMTQLTQAMAGSY